MRNHKNKIMYIKVASIIEILIGLATGGIGVYIFLLSKVSPGPTVIVGFLLGIPMILLGIFLIIFGINLWQLKKWARSASIIILVIVIAFYAVLWFLTSWLIFSLWGVGAIVCLFNIVNIRKGKIFQNEN